MDNEQTGTGSVLQYLKDNFLGKVVTNSRSAAGNWLELTLLEIEKGKAAISLTVKREMTNPFGNIHGGMMALVIDEAIGWAVISLDAETHYTSMNLNVDFLYAIKEGDVLRAEANVIRHGKKIVHAECSVYNYNTMVLLARASSNLITTGMALQPADY
ncbi:MAG: PaaI family thioesterase [Taibaiella sp.]|nr:PaaI family thioesterase [Taibaiella sp.]